jgi:hypothetical protein
MITNDRCSNIPSISIIGAASGLFIINCESEIIEQLSIDTTVSPEQINLSNKLI